MAKIDQELTTLRFDGPRFEDHGLEIDVLPELVAYKKLLLETAKDLWRRRHPDRERLPKGFETSVSVKFFRLGEGSTSVPLMREIRIAEGQLPFLIEDELDDAADIIEASIEAAGDDRPLPENLPKNVIPLFAEFGKSLAENESIYARARRREREARYTPKVRERLTRWVEPIYEDKVDVTGEVRAADLDGCNFVLRQDDGRKLPGKFDPAQETSFTEALREHAVRRLRLKGLGEFVHDSGALKRIVRVDEVKVLGIGEEEFDPTARPIWEVIAELGATVADEEWAKVPPDLSKNLDHYLYGAPKTEE